jgi:tRNA pseudouridine55 synthase
LEELASWPNPKIDRWLLPPDTLLQTLPAVILDSSDAQRFSHGNPVAQIGR